MQGSPQTTDPKVTEIVYIAGFPRSGSTLLGDLLAARFHAEHVGESARLFRRMEKGGRGCSCGQPLADCRRWSRAVKEVSDQFDYTEASALALAMHYYTGLRPRKPNVRGPLAASSHRLAAFMSDVLADIAREADGLIIDSSKRPHYARMLSSFGVRLRVIHLVRDPRAALNSRQRKATSTGTTGSRRLFTSAVDSLRWNRANVTAGRLALQNSPSTFVRYEDLVADPAAELDRIAGEIGLQRRLHDPSSETVESDQEFHLTRHHVLWGSRGARSGNVKIKADLRWHSELGGIDRRLISALCTVGMRRYGYSRQP